MIVYWLVQGVGVIVFLIGIIIFFNCDECCFKKQFLVYSVVIGVYFFFLGIYFVGVSVIFNVICILIILCMCSLWVMVIFIVLIGGIGFVKFYYFVELLLVIGMIVSIWVLFCCKGLIMCCVMWFLMCCWVIYNFWVGLIGGMMIEGSFLFMNGLNIICFWWMQKRGIDLFKVEKIFFVIDERG